MKLAKKQLWNKGRTLDASIQRGLKIADFEFEENSKITWFQPAIGNKKHAFPILMSGPKRGRRRSAAVVHDFC